MGAQEALFRLPWRWQWVPQKNRYIFVNRQIVTSEKTLIWRKKSPKMGQWKDDHLLVARRQSSYKHSSRNGSLQAEEHAARDAERGLWHRLCLSGISDRRLVETSTDHDYIESSILMTVQCDQVLLHLKTDSHIVCRAHAAPLPFPCRSPAMLCRYFTHVIPWPCPVPTVPCPSWKSAW